jgi:hypothetical protein
MEKRRRVMMIIYKRIQIYQGIVGNTYVPFRYSCFSSAAMCMDSLLSSSFKLPESTKEKMLLRTNLCRTLMRGTASTKQSLSKGPVRICVLSSRGMRGRPKLCLTLGNTSVHSHSRYTDTFQLSSLNLGWWATVKGQTETN